MKEPGPAANQDRHRAAGQEWHPAWKDLAPRPDQADRQYQPDPAAGREQQAPDPDVRRQRRHVHPEGHGVSQVSRTRQYGSGPTAARKVITRRCRSTQRPGRSRSRSRCAVRPATSSHSSAIAARAQHQLRSGPTGRSARRAGAANTSSCLRRAAAPVTRGHIALPTAIATQPADPRLPDQRIARGHRARRSRPAPSDSRRS